MFVQWQLLLYVSTVILVSIIVEQICGAHGQHCQSGLWRSWDVTATMYKENTVVKESCVYPDSDISNPVTSISSFAIAAPVLLIQDNLFGFGVIVVSFYLALMSFWWHSSLSAESHHLDVSAFRTLGAAFAADAFNAAFGYRIIYGFLVVFAVLGYFVTSTVLYHVLFITIPIVLSASAILFYYFYIDSPDKRWIFDNVYAIVAILCGIIATIFLEVDSHWTCPSSYNWLNVHVYGHIFLGLSLYYFVLSLNTQKNTPISNYIPLSGLF